MISMNEDFDLNAKLDQLLEAVNGIAAKVDEHQSRIDELDSVLYDGLIGPANEQLAQNEYNNALSDFRTKYAEKLSPYEGFTKAVEGDDFDIYKAAFDGYNDGEYDFSPDEYVDKKVVELAEQAEAIKEAVAQIAGVEPEQVDVDVNTDNSGVTVDVDDKTTEEKPEDNTTEVEATEETKETSEEAPEEKKDESAEEESEDKEDDGEETLEEFEESLRKEAEKDKDHSWIRG